MPARVMSLAILVLVTGAWAAQAQEPSGRVLYEDSCASCHGPDGSGTDYGPSLTEVGAAAADFQLRTGRMPLADPGSQAVRKPPALSDEEIARLTAYVGSFGNGPIVPQVDVSAGDLVAGQILFTENCAACHGATGNGGAAGAGALAPSLYEADGVEVVEATITGPGEMPKFTFDGHERASIARFVGYLQSSDAPGGADIGGIGPVPEGFVAWLVGIGSLVLACFFIGSKARGGPGT